MPIPVTQHAPPRRPINDMADAIVALINSQPRSPTKAEIAEAIIAASGKGLGNHDALGVPASVVMERTPMNHHFRFESQPHAYEERQAQETLRTQIGKTLEEYCAASIAAAHEKDGTPEHAAAETRAEAAYDRLWQLSDDLFTRPITTLDDCVAYARLIEMFHDLPHVADAQHQPLLGDKAISMLALRLLQQAGVARLSEPLTESELERRFPAFPDEDGYDDQQECGALPAAPGSAAAIAGFVEDMGGITAVADLCGVDPSDVHSWARRGFIPPGWHLRLWIECLKQDLQIDPALVFGTSKEDAQVLSNTRSADAKPPQRPRGISAAAEPSAREFVTYVRQRRRAYKATIRDIGARSTAPGIDLNAEERLWEAALPFEHEFDALVRQHASEPARCWEDVVVRAELCRAFVPEHPSGQIDREGAEFANTDALINLMTAVLELDDAWPEPYSIHPKI